MKSSKKYKQQLKTLSKEHDMDQTPTNETPKADGSWVGEVIDPKLIAKKRQEHREDWEDAVENAWNTLGHDQQQHCTNPAMINRWWPGTKAKKAS